MDPFFDFRGRSAMACLQNLDAIEHVENSKHRTILLALRDTNATSTEIAEQVGVQISTVYTDWPYFTP